MALNSYGNSVPTSDCVQLEWNGWSEENADASVVAAPEDFELYAGILSLLQCVILRHENQKRVN